MRRMSDRARPARRDWICRSSASPETRTLPPESRRFKIPRRQVGKSGGCWIRYLLLWQRFKGHGPLHKSPYQRPRTEKSGQRARCCSLSEGYDSPFDLDSLDLLATWKAHNEAGRTSQSARPSGCAHRRGPTAASSDSGSSPRHRPCRVDAFLQRLAARQSGRRAACRRGPTTEYLPDHGRYAPRPWLRPLTRRKVCRARDRTRRLPFRRWSVDLTIIPDRSQTRA
jgi:hypothetical protein